MSDPAPTCETCHGRGWVMSSDNYVEAYCSCPAGERLHERDGGGNRYGCGGARHERASIGVGEARFSCGHVARSKSFGAEMLREAEGPCSRCTTGTGS